MTLRSSIASLGNSASRNCCSSSRAGFELGLLGLGNGAHFRFGRRIGDQAVNPSSSCFAARMGPLATGAISANSRDNLT